MHEYDPKRTEVKRIVVLGTRISGYMSACLKALREDHQVALLLFRTPALKEAPYEARHFSWITELHNRQAYSEGEIQERIRQFDPQAVLMSGWSDAGYLRVARAVRREGVPVIAGMDRPWTGSLRQYLGSMASPWYLHDAIDVLWVAGERQRQFAHRLGYTGPRCWEGVYACDWSRFDAVYQRTSNRRRGFLYVGRYLPRKGMEVLIDAYRTYRKRVPEPWPLICVGNGPLKTLLAREQGVVDRGFVQPDALPEVMAEASAFILPSNWEPWGVVVQEAAASGLPLICSDACGAAVHLLQDGYNGFLFEAGNSPHLLKCLETMTHTSDEKRSLMGRRSHDLSRQYTPRRWAETFVQGVKAMSENRL